MTATTLVAPLKTSLVLGKGTGEPTFTRATDAIMYPDNEGKAITVPTGCARFSGGRFVYNHITASTLFGGWIVQSGTGSITTGITDPDGGSTAVSMPSTSTGAQWRSPLMADIRDNAKVNYSIWLKGSIASQAVQIKMFNAGAGSLTSDLVITTSWVRYNMAYTTGAGVVYAYVLPDTTMGSNHVFAAFPQVETVSGMADQTPSEFVSKGVLSSPWHGAGIDGAKWFSTNKDGTPIPDALLLGRLKEPASTNTLLWCRDFTNAAWVKTTATAALTGTGLGNIANTCSVLTATSANATILQTITTAAVAASSGFYVKRSVGAGTISITRDGGSTWTDVTSLINSSTFTRVSILNTSVLNPSIGFKISASGDAIIVDYGQNETGPRLWSPIATTTAAVTRNEDMLSYQTASNFSDTNGAIIATVISSDWSNISGKIGGANGLGSSSAFNGVIASDGTNTANGPTGTPAGSKKLGVRWQSGVLQAASDGVAGSAGSYDGSFNLSSIAIGIYGNTRDLKIYTDAVSESEFKGLTASGGINMMLMGVG